MTGGAGTDNLMCGYPWGLKGKTAKPSRTRRCDRGRNLQRATVLILLNGKAQGVGRSGSQKTCPDHTVARGEGKTAGRVP